MSHLMTGNDQRDGSCDDYKDGRRQTFQEAMVEERTVCKSDKFRSSRESDGENRFDDETNAHLYSRKGQLPEEGCKGSETSLPLRTQ